MEISPNEFVRTFDVLALFIYKKSPRGRRHDRNQMFLPGAFESTTLSFDKSGQVYLNVNRFVDFKGVAKTTENLIPGNPVVISLGHKDGSTWEVYVDSTVDEICALRSPIRLDSIDEQASGTAA